MGNEGGLLLTEWWSFIKIAIALELTNAAWAFPKGSSSNPRNYSPQDVTNRLKWELRQELLVDVIGTSSTASRRRKTYQLEFFESVAKSGDKTR